MDREEALKQIRNWSFPKEMGEMLRVLIPELRESEDERIRKHLIAIVELYWGKTNDPDKAKDLAWLKKQKEQKPNIEICPHTIKSMSYKENGYPIEDCDYGLEIAQSILEKTLGKVEGYQSDDGIREHQTAIQAVKDAMKERKPAEWNTFDTYMLTGLIHFLESQKTEESEAKDPSMQDIINWANSLPERFNIQPKQEWSEEDRKNLELVTDCVYDFYPDPVMKYKLKDWLKSLCPQKLDASKLDNFDPVDVLNRIKREWPMAWEKVVGKQEWSEEDERMRQTAIEACKTVAEDYVNSNERFYKCKYWLETKLKSLHPQTKAEPTLLDKNIINAAVAFVEQNDHFNCWGGVDRHTVLSALRSLKPHWKPSEEQMEALRVTLEYMPDTFKPRCTLMTLQNDLEKLM